MEPELTIVYDYDCINQQPNKELKMRIANGTKKKKKKEKLQNYSHPFGYIIVLCAMHCGLLHIFAQGAVQFRLCNHKQMVTIHESIHTYIHLNGKYERILCIMWMVTKTNLNFFPSWIFLRIMPNVALPLLCTTHWLGILIDDKHQTHMKCETSFSRIHFIFVPKWIRVWCIQYTYGI